MASVAFETVMLDSDIDKCLTTRVNVPLTFPNNVILSEAHVAAGAMTSYSEHNAAVLNFHSAEWHDKK